MKTATRLLGLALGSVLALGAFFTTSAFACSTDAWTGSATPGAVAGPSEGASARGPKESDPLLSTARVVGKCGLRTTGTGIVTDNTPNAETAFIARFYFFGKNLPTGITHTIFRASSADDGGGEELFNITYDGSHIAIETSAPSGGSASAAAISDRWNLVEVSWSNGLGGSLWVNADATRTGSASATFTSGTGAISSVQLGAVSDVGASVAFFDDYVSHRTTPVGPVLLGDVNKDGLANMSDAQAVLKEGARYNPVIQDGTPDCNLDGLVNIEDATNILLAADEVNRCTNGAL